MSALARAVDDPPVEFEREHGSTEAEWLRCLPGAVGAHRLVLASPGRAMVALQPAGELQLDWQVLPERQIALVRLPRLRVRYRFGPATSAGQREAFLRYFDLFMRRGGG